MIVVKYEEEQVNAITGEVTIVQLGIESHTNIEEVLLPDNPNPNNPIFFTKKFQGNAEYRWEVKSISQDLVVSPRTYIVKLARKQQISKQHYLKNIIAGRAKNAGHVITQWSILEVEFGHAFTVGKENGDIRSSKRYADTMQSLNMPKRRLAIVIQVHSVKELVQVIPISSKPPRNSDLTMVEVTSILKDMTLYQKPSWAVCNMIQTVTASRIMAPMTNLPHGGYARDTRFRTQIKGELRNALKDAIMHGVAASGRVHAAQTHAKTLEEKQELEAEKSALTNELESLKSQVKVYESFAKHMEVDFATLEKDYGSA